MSDILKPTSQVTVSVATPTDDYVEVKGTTTRKIVWEAFGFEPGFAFKVFSETEGGKEIVTANIVTQEEEVFSGFLTTKDSGYTANLEDANSKKKAKIEMSFKEESCTNPDGSAAKYSTTIKIGERTMSGCASKFN